MNLVKRTERGWAGHFCCAHDCQFRRNTLIEFGDIKIVVSTVGLLRDTTNRRKHTFLEIGCNRYYETMAFHSDPKDHRYHDADVSRQIGFDSPWTISTLDADDAANDMHETVVHEITARLLKGETFSVNV